MSNTIIRIFVFILVCCFVGWLVCDIDAETTYSWYAGIWHGMFIIPNFIRSIFTDALYKAENYTTAYNIFYWIVGGISVVSVTLSGIIRLL